MSPLARTGFRGKGNRQGEESERPVGSRCNRLRRSGLDIARTRAVECGEPIYGVGPDHQPPHLGEVANQGSLGQEKYRRRQTPDGAQCAGARHMSKGETMLRNTLRMINQQDQWFNQLRREESARRTLRYSLYQALEQVERLLESDMMEVPLEMQARLRQIVEAVDSQLAYRMDQSGPSALDIQDIIFEAQDRLIKQVRT